MEREVTSSTYVHEAEIIQSDNGLETLSNIVVQFIVGRSYELISLFS